MCNLTDKVSYLDTGVFPLFFPFSQQKNKQKKPFSKHFKVYHKYYVKPKYLYSKKIKLMMNTVILWKSSSQRLIWGLYSQVKTLALPCLPTE